MPELIRDRFWLNLYWAINHCLTQPCRSLFNFVLVTFTLKIVMTFEGLTLQEKIPESIWLRLAKFYPNVNAVEPTFLDVLEAELTLTVK